MELLWKPFELKNIRDPYPMYSALREKFPMYRAPSGDWVITRYDHARAILKDPAFRNGNRIDWLERGVAKYADKWDVFENILEVVKPFIAFQNAPKHAVLRKFILQAWDQKEVDSIIEENIHFLLNRIDPAKFDFATEIAKPLPAMTIGRILGVPAEDYRYLEQLSHEMVAAFDLYLNYRNFVEVEKAALGFMDYFEKQIVHKKKYPDNGLLSKLVQLNSDESFITHQELVSNSFFLFLSGEETTASLISLALLHLVNEERYDQLRSNPDWTATAIEEILRFDAPAQLIARTATQTVQLDGTMIEAGDQLTVCLGAANRDPEQFADPDTLVLNRTPNRHLSFGQGAHYCLGDWLGKKELQFVLREMAKRFPKIEILDEPRWRENLSLRSLTTLTLKAYA